jgi:hypothetical protein
MPIIKQARMKAKTVNTNNRRSSNATLPSADGLDTAALSKILSRTTNSYKFLFFISILDVLRERDFQSAGQISFFDLTVEMLVKAWTPHKKFNLSFGVQDTITSKMDDLNLKLPVNWWKNDKQALRQAIASADLKNAERLMDFVPYRLISPFLEEELAGVDKGEWLTLELALPAIANKNFLVKKPIYRFDFDDYKECSAIILHPEWVEYFKANFAAVYDWTLSGWIEYMAKRNPEVSGVAEMLA